ncbi:MAG: ABC transporter ATP-binding protein [Nitrospinae bacterium]|nr:ABC transporter ATP-binding protein [Nitrospinota bacterium]
MENGKVVEIKELYFKYPDGSDVLKGINFSISRGESVGIIGPNGAGKSTLLLNLNGILIGNGQIRIMGMELNKKNLKEIREKIGIVFQNPDDQLFCPTVWEDVAFGPQNMGFSEDDISKRVREAMGTVRLSGFEKRSPHHLSLGEKKRVSLATVLSMTPDIIAFDEPSSNLDPNSQKLLIHAIKALSSTKIVVTHDLYLAGDICSRLIILFDGEIVADGEAKEILGNQELLNRYGLPFGDRCKICSVNIDSSQDTLKSM